MDEVLESEQKISHNPDWLTLEDPTLEDPARNIWPNRKKKCSWEAECTGNFDVPIIIAQEHLTEKSA